MTGKVTPTYYCRLFSHLAVYLILTYILKIYKLSITDIGNSQNNGQKPSKFLVLSIQSIHVYRRMLIQ